MLSTFAVSDWIIGEIDCAGIGTTGVGDTVFVFVGAVVGITKGDSAVVTDWFFLSGKDFSAATEDADVNLMTGDYFILFLVDVNVFIFVAVGLFWFTFNAPSPYPYPSYPSLISF